MKKKHIFLLAVVLLTGCLKDLDPADDGGITVEASIGAPTKVSYEGDASAFASGDRIAVYAWTGDASAVPASRVVDGVVNTFDGSAWTPASLMRWKSGTDAHHFLGISPVHDITSFTSDALTLNTSDYAASDLLVARKSDVVPSETPVALGFSHVMARLSVNIILRDQYSTADVTGVTVQAKNGASVNYLTGTVSATGTAANQPIPAANNVPAGFNLGYSGIQVPQEGVHKITVTVGGQEYIYWSETDIPLVGGKHTTLNFTIGKDKIHIDGVSVSEWSDGGTLPGGEAMVDCSRIPLTFEAIEAGAEVTFSLASEVTGVEYSTDGSTWEVYSSNTPITLTNVGDIVMFRGDKPRYYVGSSDYSHFSCSAACSVYGNIMSLVSSTDFATATTLTADNAFRSLFRDNLNLRSDASKPLVLPATTLTGSCYAYMFQHCTGLSSAPALPATTLTNECYHYMFQECTGLSSAPALPATTLAYECYYGMFQRCTGLTSAPALPATTLAAYCYEQMFDACSNLKSAPDLPATTLTENCYKRMFSYCSSLNSITCAATDISAEDCTLDWLNGVADSGTFIGSSKAGWTSNSVSGIPSGWTLADSSLPLTFEAIEAGAEVTFSLASTVTGVQYSTDGSTWKEYSSNTPITLTKFGDIVMFRGDNAGYYVSSTDYSHFSCSAACSVYGNIMSLVSSTDYATATTLTADNAFRSLFRDNLNLRSDAFKALVLPATTLAESCYAQMFSNCKGLKSAPALPATTLAGACFKEMFFGCTGLTLAPALPATSLAENCYQSMFYECKGLSSAPELPATTLAAGCYFSMFQYCTGLSSAPELPATTLAAGCYENMFNGCTGLTSAPALPATTLADYCYSDMFQGCKGLTSAPALPATTLAVDCYAYMFSGCTGLTSAPALPATTLAEYCYAYMFSGCTGLSSAPELPATTLADACYYYMFSNYTGLTSAPALPATTLANYCYYGMFQSCKGLTSAPELPAMTLAEYCYAYMFDGCSSLNSITCAATSFLDSSCTFMWLSNVAASGTFTTPSTTGWSSGINGIPLNWKRVDLL